MITLEAAFQGFFLIIVIHCKYAWEFPWGLLSSKAAGCMSSVLVATLWVFLEYFTLLTFYYVNGCFFEGNCPLCLLQYFKYTFYFNLPWRKSFLESTLRGFIFGKCLVLDQSFVKRQL